MIESGILAHYATVSLFKYNAFKDSKIENIVVNKNSHKFLRLI